MSRNGHKRYQPKQKKDEPKLKKKDERESLSVTDGWLETGNLSVEGRWDLAGKS